MLVKFLGVIDILAGFIIIFGDMLGISKIIFLLLGVSLFIKSLLGFPKNFASWIDIFCGIILILSLFFNFPIFILAISGLLILQKGIFSFL